MKEFLRRSGWLMLALLFVVTSLGVVIGTFLFNDSGGGNQNAANENTCQIESVVGQPLPEPAAYKLEGDVTKLKVEDLEAGNGKVAQRGSCITVKYYGSLAKDGKKFDGNFDAPLGLKLKIGVGQVIQGWDEGVLGMKEGGTRRLIIPSELAYGNTQTSSIPPNSDLVFVVKLLKVE